MPSLAEHRQTAALIRKAYELITRYSAATRPCCECGDPVAVSGGHAGPVSCAVCAALSGRSEQSGVRPVELCSLCREPTAPHLLEDMRAVDERLRGCCPRCLEAVEDLGPEDAMARTREAVL